MHVSNKGNAKTTHGNTMENSPAVESDVSSAKAPARGAKAAAYKEHPIADGSVHSTYLVDRTVPAFGVTWDLPVSDDDRARPLCFEIHQGLGELETRLMTSENHVMTSRRWYADTT